MLALSTSTELISVNKALIMSLFLVLSFFVFHVWNAPPIAQKLDHDYKEFAL